ncbi:putative Ig domain-containing protein [Brucellaceae bacterium C25G]
MIRFLIISILFIFNLFFYIETSYASVENYELKFSAGYRVSKKLILSKDSADWKTTVWIYHKGDNIPGLKVYSDNYSQIYITGKPEKIGTYKITYKKPGLLYNDYANIIIHIDEEHLNINNDHLKPAQVGKPYYYELDFSGGMGPYSWSAVPLPEGLRINDYGEISGTPKEKFGGFVTFTATDAIGTKTSVDLYLSVKPADLAIVTEKLPASRIGDAYHYKMEFSGGSAPYHWSATGLPVGLSISQDGIISGTPAESFDGDISIHVRDYYGDNVTKRIGLQISETGLVISTSDLPSGKVGVDYQHQLSATGGSAPYHWSAEGLPAGLQLTTDGMIHGTPKQSFADDVTFQMTDDKAGKVIKRIGLKISAADLVITTSDLPSGKVGVDYQYQLSGAGGTAPYQWSAEGLPAGLQLTTDGMIHGTPQQSFAGDVMIKVSDDKTGNATKRIGLKISAADLVITTSDLPSGKVGVDYQYQLSGAGGSAPYQWSAEGLPAGLQLTTDGMIHGTPQQSFAGDVMIKVSDDKTGNATKRIGLKISAADLVITTSDLPSGKVGVDYQYELSGAGGSAPYHWSAEGLPAGLQLTTDGMIHGTPQQSFADDVMIKVSDDKTGNATKRIGLKISAADLVISTSDLPSGKVGVDYQYQLSGAGGSAPYHWSAEGLPAGLQLTSDGMIHGTPQQSFAGDVMIKVSDDKTGKAIKRIGLKISAADLVITTSDLPSGKVGVDYQHQLSATGGAAPYHWSAEGLPAGLQLTADGMIRGTPKQSFAGDVMIKVSDEKVGKAIKRIGLKISAADLVITTSDLPSGKVGVDYQYQLSGAGGSAPYQWSAEGLPAGLQLTADGMIRGTPKQSFAGDVMIKVSDEKVGKAIKRIGLKISAADLVITTSDLPSGKVGVDYQYQLSGAGGSAPYQWSAEGLPAGLRVTTDGMIHGTPHQSFAGDVMIQLTDSAGVTVRKNQSLSIAGLPLFQAQNHHLVIIQGATGSVDLVGKVSGAVVTSANIVTHDNVHSGKAWIEHGKNKQILFFTASPNFSGKTEINYRLVSGDRFSNIASVSIDVLARPDPATDQDVVGLVNAQVQSANRLVQMQNRNFQQRLEQFNDADECLQDSIGLSIGLDGAKLEPKLPSSIICSQRNYALWTAGEINLAKSPNGEASKSMKHNSIGVSGGIDYRINSSFIAGLGIGYGKDTSNIGNKGTKNRAKQLAFVTYGSYRPDENIFLNGILGYGWLNFQSDRHVVLTGQKALGERNGHQIFGSLALGYTFRHENWILAPYLKGEAAFTRLASFTEKGAGLYNLRYDRQSVNMQSLTLGLRGEYIVPTTWGDMKTKARVEYVHDFSGSSRSRLGYSDMGGLMPFVINGASDKKDHLRFELGLDTCIMNDWMAGFGYSSQISTSGGTPEHGFKWKLSKGF